MLCISTSILLACLFPAPLPFLAFPMSHGSDLHVDVWGASWCTCMIVTLTLSLISDIREKTLTVYRYLGLYIAWLVNGNNDLVDQSPLAPAHQI